MANIINFPIQPSRRDWRAAEKAFVDSMFDTMLEMVDRTRNLRERELQCSSCGIDFLEGNNEKSDMMPAANFCSLECRNEAEESVENNRRTDIRPGSY